jgi:hypothetical protein
VSRRPFRGGPSPATVAAGLGAAWGLAGYALLWGHTPIMPTRSFVVSPAGTLLLLPVRIVLWGIRLVEERIVGHAFDFSRTNAWIGLAAGAVGAALVLLAFLSVRALVRRLRARAASRRRARLPARLRSD